MFDFSCSETKTELIKRVQGQLQQWEKQLDHIQTGREQAGECLRMPNKFSALALILEVQCSNLSGLQILVKSKTNMRSHDEEVQNCMGHMLL